MSQTLEKTDLLEQYKIEIRQALTIRKTEERLLDLFKEGKLFGTVHTCIGQEFVGIAVARGLAVQDTVFSNHRCHGHFLARCRDLPGLVGEVMGRSNGVCGGRGGSQHLHRDNFYSNGIQGGIVPVATGLGYGHKLKGTNGISVVFIGDGTLGEGALYESLNIASRWSLPVLFVCENNLYAQSTSQHQTLAGSIVARAEAFGIEAAHNDTWDWPALCKAMASSVEAVRAEGRPRFHQVDTYRLMAHSKGDDNRPEEEIAPYRERDPINQLLSRYAADPRLQELLDEVEREIARAVAAAAAAPFTELDLSAQRQTAGDRVWQAVEFPRIRVVEAVRKGLERGLAEHDNLVLIGEDIESPYGGAFKCTAGLSERFPERVRNTPISEAAIVGVGNGLALSGLVPVVEIMFGDFLTLAADQWINHAAKFSWMYDEQVRVPLVVRTPMGGKRGYAATHSQSIEKHFLGLPGTQVLCLHHRYSPEALYADLFAAIDRPTLVVENKILYGQYASADPPAGFRLRRTDETFPMVHLQAELPAELTLVAIGGMSLEAEQAVLRLFEEAEVVADLFLPTCLYPFDIGALEASLRQTRRLLVVEEGQGFVSLSSEVLAQVAECWGQLGINSTRLVASPCPIPASRPAEEQCLPGADEIFNKAIEVLSESGG